MPTARSFSMQGKAIDMLAAATDLFAEQGYSATTTLQIAREAGVTEPLLYYHFNSKDGCYGYATRLAHTGYAEVLAAVEAVQGGMARLAACTDRHCDFAREFPAQARLVSNPVPSRLRHGREDIEAVIAESRRRLTRLLKGCMEEGAKSGEMAAVPAADNVAVLASLLMAVLAGEIVVPGTAGRMRKTLSDFCRRALAA